MTYPCPVGSCEDTFEKRTSQMNHIRMKRDDKHDEMYQRLNESGTPIDDTEDENSDNNVDSDEETPELSETFEDEYGDEEEENTAEDVIEWDEPAEEVSSPEGFRELDGSDQIEAKLLDQGYEYIEDKPSKPVADREVK